MMIPEPMTSEWSLPNAKFLAEMSALSYASVLPIAWGDSASVHEMDNSAVLVAKNDTDVVVAFRGSDDFDDWRSNFNMSLVPASGLPGRVHRGSSVTLERIAPALSPTMDELSDRRLWVTGHSLGGQLAMLYSCKIAQQGVMPMAVYTFGAPRPGDAAFRARYNALLGERTSRVAYRYDPVPLVPGLIQSFRHPGVTRWIDRDTVYGGMGVSLDRIHDVVRALSERRMLRELIESGWEHPDHGLQQYIAALARVVA